MTNLRTSVNSHAHYVTDLLECKRMHHVLNTHLYNMNQLTGHSAHILQFSNEICHMNQISVVQATSTLQRKLRQYTEASAPLVLLFSISKKKWIQTGWAPVWLKKLELDIHVVR